MFLEKHEIEIQKKPGVSILQLLMGKKLFYSIPSKN